MRKLLSASLVLLTAVAFLPSALAAAPTSARRPNTAREDGTIKGKAKDARGAYLPQTKIRVRDSKTGALITEVLSDDAGGFTAAVPAGSYIVEVVGANGLVIGLSPAIAVAAGTTATLTITASAVAAATTAAAAGGGVTMFGLGTAATLGVLGAAGTAVIVGVAVTKSNASPSR